jgi:hypothetical protein
MKVPPDTPNDLTSSTKSVDRALESNAAQRSSPAYLEMRTLFEEVSIGGAKDCPNSFCSLETILDKVEYECKRGFQKKMTFAETSLDRKIDLMEWDSKTVHTRNTNMKRRRSGPVMKAPRRSPRSRPTLDVRRLSPKVSGKHLGATRVNPPAPGRCRWDEFATEDQIPKSPLTQPKRSRDRQNKNSSMHDSMLLEDAIFTDALECTRSDHDDNDSSEQSMWKSCNRSNNW